VGEGGGGRRGRNDPVRAHSSSVFFLLLLKFVILSSFDFFVVEKGLTCCLPHKAHFTLYKSIVLGYGLDDWCSRVPFLVGLGIFLFTTASRMAVGPIQPPIQCVPGALSLGVKQLGCEADNFTFTLY
jgi:hypothetical protein